MDRFESMSAYVAVVEAGGFSAASRRLGMPLATVSRKVSELEDQLGARLLTRSSRKVTLTEIGERYFEACRRILEDVGEAERAASGESSNPRGELVVTAPVGFGQLHVVPVVIAFLQAFPEIQIRLLLSDQVVDLIEEHVDLAVRLGELPDSSMVATRVGSIGPVICASPAYLSARGTPSRPDDLARHDCLTFANLNPYRQWRLRIGGAAVAVTIRPRAAVSTAEAAVEMASAGLGLTQVLSYQAAAAIAEGRLVKVLEGYAPAPDPVSLVYPSGRLVPIKLRAFLDFTLPRIKARLQDL